MARIWNCLKSQLSRWDGCIIMESWSGPRPPVLGWLWWSVKMKEEGAVMSLNPRLHILTLGLALEFPQRGIGCKTLTGRYSGWKALVWTKEFKAWIRKRKLISMSKLLLSCQCLSMEDLFYLFTCEFKVKSRDLGDREFQRFSPEVLIGCCAGCLV